MNPFSENSVSTSGWGNDKGGYRTALDEVSVPGLRRIEEHHAKEEGDRGKLANGLHDPK